MNEESNRKDVIIVGGGIAGLTAAMHTSLMSLNSVIIEKSPYMGQIPESILRKNYPGLRNIKGGDLARDIEAQAKRDFSVDIKREEVIDVVMDRTAIPYRFLVKTDYGHYLSKALILATGSRPRHLNVEGTSLDGATYHPVYDSQEFNGKDVVIVGARDPSIQFACWLRGKARSVTLVEEAGTPPASPMSLNDLNDIMKKRAVPVKLFTKHTVEALRGSERVEKVAVRNIETGEKSEIPAGAVIISIGRIPNSKLAEKLGCEIDKNGFVVVNREQKTALDGVFAAGDVAGIVFNAIKSAGEGCVAGLKAAEYLKTGLW
ncbi:MAG: FAD-dependent oxidoreductase [Thermoplasmata archaeon]|nr:FAD-dependent oxidoreductase [Thermoplasmata archaeon]